MTQTRLLTNSDGPVLTVTLNRPELHNAFDETLIAELTDCFVQAGRDPTVRVVVLAGAGESFCAGADLAWMGRMAGCSQAENLADARTIQRMLAAIAECPKVTVARVHGAALGGGVGLVAACDIAVAASDSPQSMPQPAMFGFTEIRLGLAPAVIAPYVLQKISPGAARALFLTGRRFSAVEAYELGLVQDIVGQRGLDGAVQMAIQAVLQAGPNTVASVKALLRDIDGKAPADAADMTTECIAALRVSPEGQEGIRAFLEKRKPGWAV